jgi:polysaccharide export outer membrane protein
VLGLALAVALGGTRAAAQEPVTPPAAPAAAAPAASVAESQPATYKLERGDEITIKVLNLPELEDTVRVRPDGKISLLLVDEVDAAGLTPRELDESLTARFKEFYQAPEVSVIVRSFAGYKVYVAGEVGQPGPLPLVGEMTALGAVIQAGGFRNTARTNSVVLLRKSNGPKPIVEKLNLKDVLTKGKPDVALQPFDVVYVPMSTIARIDLFVDQYIRQLLPITMNAGFQYIMGDRLLLVPQ